MFIGFDGDNVQSVIGKDPQRQKIGRFFDEDRVARLGEETANQIQSVRDACGDKEVVGVHRKSIAIAKKICQRRAEVAVSLLCAILQERVVGLRQNFLSGLANHIERQERKRRVAQAEVNHIGRDLCLDDEMRFHGASIIGLGISNSRHRIRVLFAIEPKGNL